MSHWDTFINIAKRWVFELPISLLIGYGVAKYILSKNKISQEIVDTKYDGDEEFKLVLLIRSDLKMGKGKVAAQCAHAAVAAYKSAGGYPNLLEAWEDCGQAKVTLKVDTEKEMDELSKRAKTMGILANTIRDAGRTQIASGSKTVCAIGPGPVNEINKVTGHLKLY